MLSSLRRQIQFSMAIEWLISTLSVMRTIIIKMPIRRPSTRQEAPTYVSCKISTTHRTASTDT